MTTISKRAVTTEEREMIQSGLILLRDSTNRAMKAPTSDAVLREFYSNRAASIQALFNSVSSLELF